MAEQLRVLSAPPKDLNLVPRTPVRWLTTACSFHSRISESMHTEVEYTHTYTQNKMNNKQYPEGIPGICEGGYELHVQSWKSGQLGSEKQSQRIP